MGGDDARRQAAESGEAGAVFGDEKVVLRGGAEGNLEVEVGAGAGFAGDGDVAAHEPAEFAGDGEPESAAAVFAGGRGIGLGEGLEELRQFFGRDADAGVAHGDVEPGALPGDGVLVQHRLGEDEDLARGGELHGVAEEIDEDLLDAVEVARDVARGAIR